MFKMNVKSITWAICAGLLLSLSTVAVGHCTEEPKKTDTTEKNRADTEKKKPSGTDNVAKAAVVNGTVIAQSTLDDEFNRFERQVSMSGRQAPTPEQQAEIKGKMLDNIIGRELLWQQAQKMGIKPDDAETEEKLATIKKGFPSEEAFTDAIQKANLNEADLKTQLSRDTVLKKLRDLVIVSKMTVSPEEVKSFYDSNPDKFKTPEMVRASHILAKVEPNADDAAKAAAKTKIESAKAKLAKGEDFATLAKEVSDCPSKEKGGDLDFFPRGKMIKPFEDAAFSMKVGDVSDIVETQFGYHIIKVTDKKADGVTPFEQVKDRIAQALKQKKSDEELVKYLDNLKSQAKIEIFSK